MRIIKRLKSNMKSYEDKHFTITEFKDVNYNLILSVENDMILKKINKRTYIKQYSESVR